MNYLMISSGSRYHGLKMVTYSYLFVHIIIKFIILFENKVAVLGKEDHALCE